MRKSSRPYFYTALLGIFVVACNGYNETGMTNTPTPQPPNQNNAVGTWNLTPTSNETESRFYPIDGIPAGYIAGIDWSEDSSKVFFYLDERPGQVDLWAYDLPSNTVQKVEPTHPWQVFSPFHTPTPFPVVSVELPGYGEPVSMSPSGKKAIFFSSEMPTPTPIPNANGEVRTIYRAEATLWLWEQGQLHNLGQIEVCGPNDYYWSENESTVAIQVLLAPPTRCQESNAWMVDLTNNQIIEIIPLKIYGDGSYVFGFAPTQEFLIFTHTSVDENGQFTKILSFNTQSHVPTELRSSHRFLYPVGWLSDEDLLVLYRDDFFDNGKPGVINLNTGELIPLLDIDQTQMIARQGFDEVALSPNRKWLAFSEEIEPFNSSKLWLAELDMQK